MLLPIDHPWANYERQGMCCAPLRCFDACRPGLVLSRFPPTATVA